MPTPATDQWLAKLGVRTTSGTAQAHAQAKGKADIPSAGGKAAAAPGMISTTDMKDEEIALEIMDDQAAILEGWATALEIFDKTMTSTSDAEARADFQKAVVDFFAGKLMGPIMSTTPATAEINAMVQGLGTEYARAKAAGASAKLRDFVNQHWQAIGALKQAMLKQRAPFAASVRKRREDHARTPLKGGPKGSDYATMHKELMAMLEGVKKVLDASTPNDLFRMLSEEWMGHQTVAGPLGIRSTAMVVIRLNPDHSVRDAHIEGEGGQKLAEQLL